jgi:class 3 adenylate cyclase/CHASE2 domain-containing sensor protein
MRQLLGWPRRNAEGSLKAPQANGDLAKSAASSRGLRRSPPARSPLPWLAGSLLGALAALLVFAPAWAERAEGLALDLLFRYGRFHPPPASDLIVHVDIDQNAIDRIGRWPWPRRRLAEAVETIDRSGARVIAIDLLFDDPSDDEEDDHRLGRALAEAHARTVLAVHFPATPRWLAALRSRTGGAERLARVREALRADVTLDAEQVIYAAALEGDWQEQVGRRLGDFKRSVIEGVARELLPAGRLSEDSIVAALVPPDKRPPPPLEHRLIRESVEALRTVAAIERRLPEARSGMVVPSAERIQAPVRAIAEGASHFGFVTATPDRDGTLRRLPLVLEHGGRLYPQLGFVAGAAFLGVPIAPSEAERIGLALGEDRLGLGGTELHSRSGRAIIAWPALRDGSGPRNLALDLARRNVLSSAFDFHRHVSIFRILRLPQLEADLEEARQPFRELTEALAREYLSEGNTGLENLDDARERDRVLADLRKEVRFYLGDTLGPPEADADEAGVLRALYDWHQLDVSMAEREAEIREVRESLVGKIVFIGWTAFGDLYPTVADGLTPGVVIHAAMANMPLSRYAISEAPRHVAFLVALLIGSLGAAAGGFGHVGPRLALLAVLILALAYACVNAFLLFETQRLFVPVATPLAALFVAWGGASVARQVLLLRERIRLAAQFGARVHRRLFEYLLEHQDVIDLAGVEREITCLFSDLAGFTSVSESLDSRRTVALLNRHMGAMNEVLTEHGAYVNKFLGDGVMAFWGAFDAVPDRAEKACRAALACLERLEELKRSLPADLASRLSMRIGIATGVVTVGDCGAPPHFSDFTAIGDSVNLASRLESANKQLGSRILADGRTRELLPPGFLVRPFGSFTVVGQTRPVDLFEIVSAAAERAGAPARDLAERTVHAVQSFRDRRLDEAREEWLKIVRDHGDSKLASLYLEEIARRIAAPEEPFDSVIRLSAK